MPQPKHRAGFIVGLLSAASLFLYFAAQISEISTGQAKVLLVEWVPQLGVELAFRLDGLSMLFCLLISGIGVLVMLYTSGYFKDHRDQGRLQWLLLAFMLSMVGLVTADNVLLLFIFWELTTITSFLLVGFDHENRQARRSSLQALLITGGGGLVLLVGLLMAAEIAGTYRVSELVLSGALLKNHDAYEFVLALILIGAFSKSAQFPFHFWLPNAMAAPSPVSAYLHSATMVKAGIYLLARFQPALGGTDMWFYTLSIIGAVTAVWASIMSLRQTDLKLMLAWTTVMSLGALTLFLGSDIRIAALAAMTFLLVHAFYKCALFLVIGNVDFATGTRDSTRLGGLAKVLPITSVAAMAACFSMAGFPPFLGFIGKELKYEGALAIAEEPYLIAAAALAANAMMVTVALTIVIRVFLKGETTSGRERIREVPWRMWIGPLILAAAGLLTGIFPDMLAKSILQPALSEVLLRETIVKLSLWHGINVPLAMSIATVAIGTVLFLKFDWVREHIEKTMQVCPITGDRIYRSVLRGIERFARGLTDRLQSGSLGQYLTTIFVVFIVTIASFWMANRVTLEFSQLTAVPPLALVISLPMMCAVLVVAISRSRILSICALGIVGSGVAVLFLLFGAIDVAITQLMVETLFVVLIASVMLNLPKFSGQEHPGRGGGVRDAVIAISCGVVICLITVAVGLSPLDLSITEFYEEASLSQAYGRNIVNVILVDFRALDTLGEVAVVAIAALAVIALLTVRSQRNPS